MKNTIIFTLVISLLILSMTFIFILDNDRNNRYDQYKLKKQMEEIEFNSLKRIMKRRYTNENR